MSHFRHSKRRRYDDVKIMKIIYSSLNKILGMRYHFISFDHSRKCAMTFSSLKEVYFTLDFNPQYFILEHLKTTR